MAFRTTIAQDFDFGVQPIGSMTGHTLTVVNTSKAILNVKGLHLNPAYTGISSCPMSRVFRITPPTLPCPIAPGASLRIAVVFNPPLVDTYRTTIFVDTNDAADTVRYSFGLAGTGRALTRGDLLWVSLGAQNYGLEPNVHGRADPDGLLSDPHPALLLRERQPGVSHYTFAPNTTNISKWGAVVWPDGCLIRGGIDPFTLFTIRDEWPEHPRHAITDHIRSAPDAFVDAVRHGQTAYLSGYSPATSSQFTGDDSNINSVFADHHLRHADKRTPFRYLSRWDCFEARIADSDARPVVVISNSIINRRREFALVTIIPCLSDNQPSVSDEQLESNSLVRIDGREIGVEGSWLAYCAGVTTVNPAYILPSGVPYFAKRLRTNWDNANHSKLSAQRRILRCVARYLDIDADTITRELPQMRTDDVTSTVTPSEHRHVD